MNDQLVRRLPIELRREIYFHLPFKPCMICKGNVVNYHRQKNNLVCSMKCLYVFNQRMIVDLALHKAIIPVFNLCIACNYFYLKLIILSVFGSMFLGYNVAVVYLLTFGINFLGIMWSFLF